MKKASRILGIGLLSVLLMSFTGKDNCDKSKEDRKAKIAMAEFQKPFINNMLSEIKTEPISIDQITYLEQDEEIDLGFDTAVYLPLGFNAYQGVELDLNEIEFLEEEQDIDLGFDTSDYLPEGFDPYKVMGSADESTTADLNLEDIIYLTEEEDIDLGFDTQQYLPAGFDASAK
ncbi:MAG: hypothetical protein KJN76_11570 [Eudoraea sp.]|nr:hypothetical protein [Eudoraea sp.]